MKCLQACTSILVLSILAFFSTSISANDKSISLVTAAQPPLGSDQHYTGFLERLGKEAFRRIGYQASLKVLPGERALINVNNGIDDGDMFRVPGFESNYPNMLRVPEKIGIMEFMAYSKNHELQSISWQKLKPYSVAFANGWKIYERKVEAKEITRVRSINNLLGLLESERADIILMDRWQAQYLAQQSGHKITPIEPPLAAFDMYMYVNKKHASIIPELTKAIQAMKKDGTYQKYYTEMQNSLN